MEAARLIGSVIWNNRQHYSKQELHDWDSILKKAPYEIEPELRAALRFAQPHVAQAVRELELRLWLPLRGQGIDRLVAKEWREYQESARDGTSYRAPTRDEAEALDEHSEIGSVSYLLVRSDVITRILQIQHRLMVRDSYYLKPRGKHDPIYRLIGQPYHVYIGKQMFDADFKNTANVDSLLTMMYGNQRPGVK